MDIIGMKYKTERRKIAELSLLNKNTKVQLIIYEMSNINRWIEAQQKRGHSKQAIKRQLLKKGYSIKAVAEVNKKLTGATIVRIVIIDIPIVMAAGAAMFSMEFVNLYVNSSKDFSKDLFNNINLDLVNSMI